jgi:hypothetical protein
MRRSRSTRRSRRADLDAAARRVHFAPFVDPQYPGGRQLFSMFLAEPRTFGLTLRALGSAPRARRRVREAAAAAAAAAAASGDADLPGRLGDPGDRRLPAAAAAAAAAAGAGARLSGSP